MAMSRRARVWAAALAAALIGVAGVAAYRAGLLSRAAGAPARYYCPMHPTYTSDRPGNCPICNMKLEPMPAQAADQFRSICYLHNCEKLHGGKPCPMTVVAKPGEKVTCPICGTHIAEAAAAAAPPQERKILYWTDPMIPGYKAKGPGKSPMGMDLVPVYEEDRPAAGGAPTPADHAPVLLTPQKQQLIGVQTAPATKRRITKTIRTVGRIAYDPSLYQTEAEFQQSLKALTAAQAAGNPAGVAEAQRLVDSSRMKLRLSGLSDALIDEIAQRDGPDKSLLLPGAEGQVWVYAPVYEYELPFVRVGQTIRVEVPSAGLTYEGLIRAIDPVLDPATRSARVRAVLTAPEGHLKPEMYVNASILITIDNVLAVPEEAVFHTGTMTLVFVDQGQGLFEPREVALGVKADGVYEVKSGLQEGEAVVTSGNFLIDSESRLKAALQGMGSGGDHQHGP